MNEDYNQQPQYDYTNKYDNGRYGTSGYRGIEINKNAILIILSVIAFILIVVLLVKSCSAGKLKGIKVGTVPIIYVGDKEEIQIATIGRGNRKDTRFDFSLKNENIAILEDDMQIGSEVQAVIKGKKPGDTTLTVKAGLGNKSYTEKVDLIVCGKLEVQNITDNNITIEKGKRKNLKLGLGENDKCYASISFDFGTEGVVRQVGNYEIEGLEAGKTTLTITDGGKGKVTYDITVIDPNAKVFATGVELNSSSLSVCVGGTKTLEAIVLPEDASDKSVMWSSNKTSVATVDNGVVTGQNLGTAQITVMTQDGSDKTATANIQVVKCSENPDPVNPTASEVKVSSITLSPSSPSVDVGSTIVVSAGIKPTDASNQTVTCKSSNTKYFTVISDGKNCVVTGVAKGSATLTVTANDKSGVSATATVNVTKSSGGSGGITCNVEHCTKCSSTNYCSSCESGYTPTNGKCEVTAVSTPCYVSHCLKCSSSYYCSTCESGYTESNGSCISNTNCGNGQAWVPYIGKCCTPIAHCQTYNSSCGCQTCSSGYTLSNGTCQKQGEDNDEYMVTLYLKNGTYGTSEKIATKKVSKNSSAYFTYNCENGYKMGGVYRSPKENCTISFDNSSVIVKNVNGDCDVLVDCNILDDPGQCYCCGNNNGCNYKWSTDGSSPGSNCGKSNKTKAQCKGDTNNECGITGCAACTTDGTKCTKCNSTNNYVLQNGKCCKSIDHCSSYDSSCKCTVCTPNSYIVKDGKCIEDPGKCYCCPSSNGICVYKWSASGSRPDNNCYQVDKSQPQCNGAQL